MTRNNYITFSSNHAEIIAANVVQNLKMIRHETNRRDQRVPRALLGYAVEHGKNVRTEQSLARSPRALIGKAPLH